MTKTVVLSLICASPFIAFTITKACFSADIVPQNNDTKNNTTLSVLLKPNTTMFDNSRTDTKPVLRAPLPDNRQPLLVCLRRIIGVTLNQDIDSRTTRSGDLISATLKDNIFYAGNIIIPAKSILTGRIISSHTSRTLGQASINDQDRFKPDASIDLAFDQISTIENRTILITGRPAHQDYSYIGQDGLYYCITIDNSGRITKAGHVLTPAQQRTANAVRVASMVPLPGSLMVNLALPPAIMTTIGAISPDVIFNHPIDPADNNGRLKGMAYGFFTALPGAFLVQSIVEKGNDIILHKGDELMVDITINNQPIVPFPPEGLIVKAKLLHKTKKGGVHNHMDNYLSTVRKNSQTASKTNSTM